MEVEAQEGCSHGLPTLTGNPQIVADKKRERKKRRKEQVTCMLLYILSGQKSERHLRSTKVRLVKFRAEE